MYFNKNKKKKIKEIPVMFTNVCCSFFLLLVETLTYVSKIFVIVRLLIEFQSKSEKNGNEMN